MEKNLYDILNISAKADYTEIKTAFRTLAKKYHPDLNNGQILPEWDDIRQAYEILIDPEKRILYDDTGYIPDTDEGIYRNVLSFLRNYFNVLISNHGDNIFNMDIIADIVGVSNTNIKNSQKEINQLKKKRERIAKLKKKFKKRKDVILKQDILLVLFAEELQNIKTDIIQHQHNMTMFKTLIKIITCYELDVIKILEQTVQETSNVG